MKRSGVLKRSVILRTHRIVDGWIKRNKDRRDPVAVGVAEELRCGLHEMTGGNANMETLTPLMAKARDKFRKALGSDVQ